MIAQRSHKGWASACHAANTNSVKMKQQPTICSVIDTRLSALGSNHLCSQRVEFLPCCILYGRMLMIEVEQCMMNNV
jgi:hypothetical protein